MIESIDQHIEQVLEAHAPGISSALRSEQSADLNRKTGKLAKSFRSRIRHDSFGFPYGLSFSIPRYGYILHHGVQAQEISDPSRNRVYHTSGIQPRGFINRALDGKIDGLADDIARAGAEGVSAVIRY